jgi:Sen15 protein
MRGWTNLRVVHQPRLHVLGSAAPGFDSVFPGVVNPSVDRTQAVVPMAVDEKLTPRILAGLCADVAHPNDGPSKRCVTAAIVDKDSTTAYYRVFDSFDEIVHPQWKQKKGRDEGDVDEEVNGIDPDDDSASVSGASSDSREIDDSD